MPPLGQVFNADKWVFESVPQWPKLSQTAFDQSLVMVLTAGEFRMIFLNRTVQEQIFFLWNLCPETSPGIRSFDPAAKESAASRQARNRD